MQSEFTLYGTLTSTATSRVRLTLAEAGFEQYEFRPLEIKSNEHKQLEHLARHPWGKVPAIVTNEGFTLFESRAICKFLAMKYHPKLLPDPSDLTAVAIFDQAQSVEAEYFSPQVTPISFEHFVKRQVLGIDFPDQAAIETAEKKLAAFFDVCESTILLKQNYMAGSQFTLVDIFYIPGVERLIACGYGRLITARPNVASWWNRCVERPAVQQFLAEEPLKAIRAGLRGASK